MRIITATPARSSGQAMESPKESARRRVLAHDEVRERAPVVVGVSDEAQPHPLLFDANDLRVEVQGWLTRQEEIDLGLGAFMNDAWCAKEQAAAREVLHETVDDDPMCTTLRPNPDGDPYCSPLVHVLNGTVQTYVHEINLPQISRIAAPRRGSDLFAASCNPRVPTADCTTRPGP